MLKTAYKHFKEAVLTSMEPVAGGSEASYAEGGINEGEQRRAKFMGIPKPTTLLEKVKSNWHDLLGLPITSE